MKNHDVQDIFKTIEILYARIIENSSNQFFLIKFKQKFKSQIFDIEIVSIAKKKIRVATIMQKRIFERTRIDDENENFENHFDRENFENYKNDFENFDNDFDNFDDDTNKNDFDYKNHIN